VRNEVLECASCGLCKANCPVFEDLRIESVSARGKIILCYNLLTGNLNPSQKLAERLFQCTTCKACTTTCLCELDIPKIIEACRSDLIELGLVPRAIRDVLVSTQRYGNPWNQPKRKRAEWVNGLEGVNLKVLSENESVRTLYFVGCTPSYDPRCREVARSMVRVFSRAGVDFGVLGEEETCCGGPMLRIGERGLFELLAERNLENFRRHNVDRVVATSPHCYNAFKNDYPLDGEGIEAQHYTQFVANLIDEGRISFSKRVDKVVVYHDPCFLGRHNGVYEPPRKILESIPGLTLIEMERTRENSFCCGGGGGMMWMEASSSTRPSLNRVREAADLKPDIIATSCPFCLLNLEDAVRAMDLEKEIQVMDVIELVEKAM